MQTPLQITFRDMDKSPALEQSIRAALDKLEEHCDRLTSCKVVVQSPHKHHLHGRLFHVTVDLTVPGREIVVGRNHEDRAEHEDAHLAVRDAFRAARRTLESYLQARRAAERSSPPVY
jgi:ribosome-associated translation inhibitor RaiA